MKVTHQTRVVLNAVKLILYTKYIHFRHLTWFGGRGLPTPLVFLRNHHNNIHYSISAYSLVKFLKGAKAKLQALLYHQFIIAPYNFYTVLK